MDILWGCGTILVTKQGPEVVGSEANGFGYKHNKEAIQ